MTDTNEITIKITQSKEGIQVCGYKVEVKRGTFSKDHYYSDDLEGAVAKSLKSISTKFKDSTFIENLVDYIGWHLGIIASKSELREKFGKREL